MGAWLLLPACSPTGARTPGARETSPGCEVVLDVARADPLVLSVSADCPALAPRAFVAEPGVGDYIAGARSPDPVASPRAAGELRVPEGSTGVKYQIELGRMAAERADLDVALQVGNSVLAPGYSWLVSPVGIPDETRVRLRLAPRLDPASFATGLMQDDAGGYGLRVNEIRVATFGVFGHFERSELSVPGLYGVEAALDIVTLDGEIAQEPSVIRQWIRDTALAVADFYGGFPVRRSLLAVVPVSGRSSVVHGKVLPESSPGLAVLVGSRVSTESLYSDWILTHELFHLGFPSFADEGKWLDEGSATYFEPLIRARKGWLSEAELWAEFYRNMPLGLGVLERDGLEKPRSVRGMYWAGAIVCLMADVEALQKSARRAGLQQGFRALLRAGGDASRVWRLKDAIRTIDAALGAPILERISSRYLGGAARVPLQQLFADLGVVESGGAIRLSDDAPLAPLRRALVRGLP